MARATHESAISAGEMTPTEAQRLLEINSSMFHSLIHSGRLPARMLDQSGAGFRRWIVKRADVLKLKAEGVRKNNTPRAKLNRALWERYFGPVPENCTPVFRDGDRNNISPNNMCLIARKNLWTPEARGLRRKGASEKQAYSEQELEYIRANYATHLSSEIAKALCRSESGIRMQARRMKLRKDISAIREKIRQRHGGKLEVGTERLHEHTDTIFVKVRDTGTFRQRWRPKHHVIWEKHHARPIPTRNVVFKDGNRRNFDPENLIAMTREESTAYCMARLGALPREMKTAARLISKIKEEATSQLLGRVEQRADRVKQSRSRRKRDASHRWTPEMIKIITRDFASKPVSQIAPTLGVTEFAARAKAKKLGLRREPAAILAEIGARTTEMRF